MSEFGRIDDDGTVYVRTADGERAVGSWQAGTPEEGLAHFARRYEVISTEVALLEQRLRSGAGDPQQVAQSATLGEGVAAQIDSRDHVVNSLRPDPTLASRISG